MSNTYDPAYWRCCEFLLRPFGRTMEPAILVQSRFGGIWPHTPREIFTEEIPTGHTADEITIDMMGTYFPEWRGIKIYTQIIDTFSRRYGFYRDDVEQIVRVHEYGHALVHLGDCRVGSFLPALFATLPILQSPPSTKLIICLLGTASTWRMHKSYEEYL